MYRPAACIGDGVLSLMGNGWGGGVQRASKNVRRLCKMLKSKRRSLIEIAIQDDTKPKRSKSSSDLLLPLDNKQYAKLQQRGRTTPADRFYFSQTQTTSETFDIEGTVVQMGSYRIFVNERYGPCVAAVGRRHL